MPKRLPRCPHPQARRRSRFVALFIVGLIGLAPVAGTAQTVFVDFNTPGEYTNNFNPWQDAGGVNGGAYSFAESSSAGVAGSGGVSVVANNDTTAVYNGGSWNFSTNGSTMIVSVLVNENGQTSANKVQVGFMNVDTNGLNANTGVTFETFRVIPTAAGIWSLREQYRTAGANTETVINNVNVVAGRWYKFVVSVTNTAGASGAYAAGCAIYDYGTDGLTPGTNIVTFNTATNHTGQTDVTVATMWPAIRAFQNAGINAWDNFLAYTSNSVPVITLPLTNVTALTGSPASFYALADGPGVISLSWYTNGILDATAAGSNYSIPALNSSYTNIAVVASNNNGATTNTATLMVVAPSLAVITNLPATGIQATSATLQGQVVSTGNDTPGITMFYGTSDGGTTPGVWAQSVSLGLQSGAFAQTVTGLSPNTTYYFAAQGTNRAGTAWATPSQSFTTALSNSSPTLISVVTYHYDNARTGQNTNETILTPANVAPASFGLLFSHAVDGQVYAEPLYVPGVIIPGQGTHNMVFVATQHDSVYAFDADSNAGANGGLLWQVSLGTSAATPNNDFGNRYGAYHDIDPEVGITSTPVIDPSTGTIYVDAFTHEGSSYFHRVHALNITNGTEQPFSPVVVTATVAGVGVDSTNSVVTFNPLQQLQRPALTLAAGMLYIASSGYADTDPYHGWVIGFNASTLQQVTNYVFNTTPNATTATFGANAAEGGIWMTGNGLCVDAGTNLYFEVGNGSFNANTTGGTEYGDSFIKLSTTKGLSVADYFTPYNQATLAANDTDLGSGGPMLLPDSVGTVSHPHLIVGCGKEGKIYLLDRDNLGQFNSVSDSQIIQELPGAVGGTWSSGAYFNSLIFYDGTGDVLKSFQLVNGLFVTTPASQSGTAFSRGATPTISANGTNNAIVWVINTDGYPGGAGVLHAYNAYNLSQEFYNSSMAGSRDNPGGAIKFTVPTVANGKVYVGADGQISAFGNGTFVATPTISPAAGLFTNSVTVTLADSTPGATIVYTLDNTTPVTNSTVYTGQFVLTNTTAVKVMAFEPGFVPSQVVVATFVNSASLSFSPGFVKQEFYSGAVRTDIENPAYTNPPTFVHYLTSFGTPSGQGVNYAERVSGLFTAPQTANYVFFVCSDDDSDLFLSTDATSANKHLVAQETAWSNPLEWLSSAGGSVVASKRSDQFTGTTWPGGNTIHLTAGTQYYLEADHHQGGGGDDLAVTFKLSTSADPANGTASALTGNVIGTSAYNNTYIDITSQPQGAIISPGGTATLSVTASSGYLGDTTGAPGPTIFYQWQSAPAGSGTFTNIPNATSNSYTTPPLTAQQNGIQYQVVLTTAGVSSTSAPASLTVTAPGPQLSVNPPALAFGTVAVGQTNKLSFQVVNSGGQTLTGTATVAAPFSVGSGSPFSLTAGQTGMVSVAFSPASSGNFSNVVVFTSNGGNLNSTVTGSGAVVPVAGFTGAPTSGVRPLNVTFTDNSTGTITGRSWNFGDGTASNAVGTSVAHTYNAAGTNTIVLTVTGPVGTNAQTRAGYVVVTNPPPLLSVSPTNLNFGLVTSGQTNTLAFQVVNNGGQTLSGTAFTALPFSISAGSPFNVAPGATGLVSVAFSPTNAGSFSNAVTFASNGGNGTNSVSGSSAAAPVASFTGTPTRGVSPLSVTFTDNSTGTITNRAWNFGDGTVSNAVGTTVAHAYNAAGTNTVVLTVTGPVGTNAQTRADYIAVTNPPPLLSVNPTNLIFGLVTSGQTNTLTFQVVNNGGQTLSGAASTALPFSISAGSPFNVAPGATGLVSVAFSPTNAGSFSNVVTFASNGGNSTNSVSGSSAAVPVASFTGTPTSGVRPLSVTFTDNSTGTITNRSWNFGDGTVSNAVGTTVAHTYNAAGTNTVVLTVSGPVGTNAQTRAGYIVVTNPPPLLSVNPTNLSFGLVTTGQTNTLAFQVVNNGGQTLSGAASTALPFSISAGSPFNVAPGATGLVSVAFSPTNAGSFSNVVTFASNGGNGTNSVSGSSAAVPVANFTGAPTNGSEPLTVTFTDNSTGTITNRYWDLGDGFTTNTSLLSLVHTYALAATNTVSLTVTGPVGTNTLSRDGYIIVTNLGPVIVTIQLLGNQANVSWPNGTLQSATDVTGPYNDLSNAVSPYTLTVSNATQFFRVRVR